MSSLFLIGCIPLVPIAGWLFIMADRWFKQATVHDKRRQTYKILFPSDLKPELVAKFINDTHGSMHRKRGLFNASSPMPSLVYEVYGTERTISHWLKVPWEYQEDIVPALQVHIPGIRLVPDSKLPEDEQYEGCRYTSAMEVGAKNSYRQFRIDEAETVSAGILKRFEHLNEGEKLRLQWVIVPAAPEQKPVYGTAKTRQFRLESLFRGPLLASREEVQDTADKLDEHTFYAALRIGAVAGTDVRAKHLVTRVVKAIKSTHGATTYFTDRWYVRDIQQRMDGGVAPDPLNFIEKPIRLSVSELTAFLAWDMGNPMVAGLTPTVAKAIPVPPSVPEIGGKVGISTYSDRDRVVAVPYSERTKHLYASGGTGSGKTSVLENLLAQDIDHKHGVIVIEGKRDLFYRGLERVPAAQIPNTIVIDFSDPSYAVGFNLLQQGNHAVAIDELKYIFNTLFKDRDSMWMVEVLDHALKTLAQSKTGTFMDVMALLRPKPHEEAWAAHLKRSVAEQELRDWWDDFDHRDKNREAKIETLKNRVWPMMVPNLMNVFGQAKSTFSMGDVIRKHMNLFINLDGLPDMSKRLAGTIFANAVWQAVQANPVDWPNFLYIDEAQDFTQLMADAREMLAKSRSYGLGTVLANQYIGQFDDDMRDAIISNVQTKLIMHSENPKDNNLLAASFGKMVKPEDFSALGRYEVLARIATPSGTSSPLTMRTLEPKPLPPGPITQLGQRVREASRKNYANRVDVIRNEMDKRRTSYGPTTTKRPRPTVSGSLIT